MSDSMGRGGSFDIECAAAYQDYAVAWLENRAPYNVMFTGTFRSEDGITYGMAKLIFAMFVGRLRDRVFGRKSKRRIAMVPVLEGYMEQMQRRGLASGFREGTHIHVLIDLPLPTAEGKEVVLQCWKETHRLCGDPAVYCPDSDRWYLEITDAPMRASLIGYVLKRCRQNLDGLLLDYM